MGCTAGAPQERWPSLRSRAAPQRLHACLPHDSRFSSGETGNRLQLQPFWQALHEAGAEIVLGGGSHMYERFAPQTAREGPTGHSAFGSSSSAPAVTRSRLSARSSATASCGRRLVRGLRLVLHLYGYDWRFQADRVIRFQRFGQRAVSRSAPRAGPQAQEEPVHAQRYPGR